MTERRTQPQQDRVAESTLGATTGAKREQGAVGPENIAGDLSPLEERPQPAGPSASADRFKGEYEYVPLECPRCGLLGKVKISRLDRTFTCKQCRRVFHVTVHGVLLGERPLEEEVSEPGAPPQPVRLNRLEKWFLKLSLGARCGVLVGALLALMAPIVLFVVMRDPPLPQSWDHLTVLAGQALAQGDWYTLNRLSASGTSESLRQWYDKARPAEFAALNKDSQVTVTLGLAEKMIREYVKKEAIVDIRTPAEIHYPSPAGETAAVQVDFLWKQDSGDRWRLDGEWMLNFSKPKKAQARPPGGDKPDHNSQT